MVSKKGKTKQIGEILIEKKLIDQEQLDKALEVQLKEGGLLGQILVKLEYVTQEQIESSISEQTSSAKKLENILIESGALNSEGITKINEALKKEGGILPEIVVKLGLLGEEDMVSLMVTQQGIPYLPLANYEIDKEIAQLIPRKIAEKFCLIAIDKIGNILTIAMADPLNVLAQDEIRKITNLSVEAFVATLSDVKKAIDQYYA